MLQTKELKDGIALVEKGLAHGPGNADLLAVLEQVHSVSIFSIAVNAYAHLCGRAE